MNLYKQKLYYQIIGFARAYPLIITISPFFAYFLTNNTDLLLLSISLMLNDILNGYFKNYIFYPLMKDKKWFILGQGKRPKGAKNSGIFLEQNAKLSTSYGMPSGHSQGAAFFSTYTILHLLESSINTEIKIIGSIFFSCLAVGIMYSRVYLGCHTKQQVIMGGLIGTILGFYYYKNKEIIKQYIFP